MKENFEIIILSSCTRAFCWNASGKKKLTQSSGFSGSACRTGIPISLLVNTSWKYYCLLSWSWTENPSSSIYCLCCSKNRVALRHWNDCSHIFMMKKWASKAYSLYLVESWAIVASIECILTSFSKWEQFKNRGWPSSSCLCDRAVFVFLEALEAPDFIDLLLLEALDTLLLLPTIDFLTLLPALEFLVLALDYLLNFDDFDFPVFLVFLSSSPSSFVSSSSSSQPGSISIRISTASKS